MLKISKLVSKPIYFTLIYVYENEFRKSKISREPHFYEKYKIYCGIPNPWREKIQDFTKQKLETLLTSVTTYYKRLKEFEYDFSTKVALSFNVILFTYNLLAQ